jgi:RHS repeat-associated protein
MGLAKGRRGRRSKAGRALQQAVVEVLEPRRLMSQTVYYVQFGSPMGAGHDEVITAQNLDQIYGFVEVDEGENWRHAAYKILDRLDPEVTTGDLDHEFWWGYEENSPYNVGTSNGDFIVIIGTMEEVEEAGYPYHLYSGDPQERIAYGSIYSGVYEVYWPVTAFSISGECAACNGPGIYPGPGVATMEAEGQDPFSIGDLGDMDVSTALATIVPNTNGMTVGQLLRAGGAAPVSLINADPGNEAPLFVVASGAQYAEIFTRASENDPFISTMTGSLDTIVDSGGVYTLTDANGAQYVFNDFSTAQFPTGVAMPKSFTDPGGNITYFDYATTGNLTGIFSARGDGATAKIMSYDTVGHMTDMVLQTIQTDFHEVNHTTGSWTVTRKETYEYNDDGMLISTTVYDGGDHLIDGTAYVYYDEPWSSESPGFVGAVKYAFGSVSFARLEKAMYPANWTTASEATLSKYADVYYEYDPAGRIAKKVSQGKGCSTCGGGDAGASTFSYDISDNDANDRNAWTSVTTETSNGMVHTVYANSSGQVLLEAVTVDGQTWVDYYRYDDEDGYLILHVNPSGIEEYNGDYFNPDFDDLVDYDGGTHIYHDKGLFEWTEYGTANTAGMAIGYPRAQAVSQGSAGTKIYQSYTEYTINTVDSREYIHVAKSVTFPTAWTDGSFTDATSNGLTTTYNYSFLEDTNQIESMTISSPTVTSAHNGPGTADVTRIVYDEFGRTIWTMDADGFINYTEYDAITGAVVKTIVDVDVDAIEITDEPEGWDTPASGGLHLTTNYTNDSLGRTVTVSDPNGNLTYTVYDDPNHAVFTFPGATMGGGSLTTTGPIQMWRSQLPYTYTLDGVNYLNGTYDESLTFSGVVTVDDGEIVLPGFTYGIVLNLWGNATAGSQYTIQALSRTLYNAQGQMVETDQYPSISNSVYLSAYTPYLGRGLPSIGVYNFGSLTLGSSTLLDIDNHDAIIGNTTLATIQNAVLHGYQFEGYSGAKIISRNSFNTSFSSVIFPMAATQFSLTSWHGVAITQPNSVVITSVLNGDANMDGAVDNSDYQIMLSNFEMATPGLANMAESWTAGDINFDGTVNGDDFTVWSSYFGNGTTVPNYSATTYEYDEMGRQARTISPNGTITNIIYDELGRTQVTFVGTQDIPNSDLNDDGFINWEDFTQGYTGGSDINMVKVSASIYDNGGVGDGNLTQSIVYPGGSQGQRMTDYLYDWRNRLITSKSGEILPAGWSNSVIGTPAPQSIVSFNGSTFIMTGGGNALSEGSTSDTFDFYSKTLTTTSNQMVAHFTQLASDADSQAGLMFRSSNATGSVFAGIVLTETGTAIFAYRLSTNGSISTVVNATGGTLTWVKLERSGSTLTGYAGTSFGSMTQVFSQSVTEMSSTHLAGIAVTADGGNNRNAVGFDNFTLNSVGFNAANVETDSARRPITVVTLDNLGQQLSVARYDGDGIAMVGSSNGNGLPVSIASQAAKLRAFSESYYDEQGRVYQSRTYNVNYTSGAYSTTSSTMYIVSNVWYDHRGQTIKSVTSGGATSKMMYDGAGRVTMSFVTDGGGDAAAGDSGNWTDAGTISGDTVLEQVEYLYDANGNVLMTTSRQRFHDNASTGALLSASNSSARVYYALNYYDGANRTIATVNPGTNGGTNGTTSGGLNLTTIPTLPAMPTVSTSTVLATFYTYNSAGYVRTISDPAGIKSFTQYDNLGRTLASVSAWDGTYMPYTETAGVLDQASAINLPASATANQTTAYTYDGSGHTVTMKAVNNTSNGGTQTTQYVYGGFTAGALQNNDLLRQIRYPIASGTGVGTPGTTSAYTETFTYDNLGEVLTKTDRNGYIHTYTYDSLGRITGDSASYKPSPTQIGTAVIKDGTFEESPSSASNYWTFTGNAGTTSGNADGTGSWVGYLTGNGGYGGAVTKEMFNAFAGTYSFGFQTKGTALLIVYVDGNSVDYHWPESSSTWDTYVTTTFTISTSGAHEIKFDTYGSGTTYIDNITILQATSAAGSGSFEEEDAASDYAIAPSSSYWSFSGNSGVSIGNSSLPSPSSGFDGSQMGFLSADYSGASISQSLSLNAGTYILSFLGAYDAYGGSVNVVVGATNLGSLAVSSSFGQRAVYFSIGSTGSYTLTLTPDPDGTSSIAFIDKIIVWKARPTASIGTLVAAQSVTTTYNTQGLPDRITSYNAASGGGTVINQIKRDYNGFGQITAEWQSHSGTVTGSTPKVSYAYAGGDKGGRLTSITYPNSSTINTVTYAYGTGGGLNDVIGRLESLANGTTSTYYETYSYLGLSTVVVRAHPEPGVDLTFVKNATESFTDGGDQYTGLDRFGRVIDQRWQKTSNSTSVDEYKYAYSASSNVTSMTNVNYTSFSEIYAYDDLSRVAKADRNNGTVNDQTWSYDGIGNIISVKTNTTTSTRTHNALNQITSVTSQVAAPTYDSHGNLTKDNLNRTYTYDAWNRLVLVNGTDGTLIRAYAYDPLGRRISETDGFATTDLYYTTSWQVVEERTGSYKATYVWSPVYVDALVARNRDTDANGTLDERLYVLHDAMYNTTGIINTSGTVQERFKSDAFGNYIVLNASWAVTTDTKQWVYVPQGKRFDAVLRQYDSRARIVSVDLMRALQPDPLGYPDGMNRYAWEVNNPITRLDPSGEKSWDLDVNTLTLTLTVRVQFEFPSTWTKADQSKFEGKYANIIMQYWNRREVRLYPSHSVIPLSYSTTHLPTYGLWGPEVSRGRGWKPWLRVVTGAGYFSRDLLVIVEPFCQQRTVNKRHTIITNNYITWLAGWGDLGLSPQNIRRSDGAPFDFDSHGIAAIHEFGHFLGLDHPGHDLPKPPPANSDADYAGGSHAEANTLMGIGMVWSNTYLEQWIESLESREITAPYGPYYAK